VRGHAHVQHERRPEARQALTTLMAHGTIDDAVGSAGKEPAGTVELVSVSVHGYRNDDVLVSGPPAGEQVVTAGVQKMAPGLKVALQGATASKANKVAGK